MGELLQDLKFGLRSLRKSPGFAAIALLTIAIGIGANAAIFSFIDGVVLKPLPYPEPGRIVRVWEKLPNGDWNSVSALNFLDWQRRGPFQYLAATGWDNSATLTGIGEPVSLHGVRVSAHYLDILGIKASLGRTFVDGEDQPGRENVVVLTHKLWLRQFGGDPAIVGKTITLGGRPNTVIGVLPQTPGLDHGWVDLYRPLAFAPDNRTRDFHWLEVLGRLREGVTFEQARTQMTAIAISIAHDFPASNKGWGVALQPLTESYVGGDTTRSLYVLMAAVGMVLLIACANLANLTLARGVSREREAAIRAALGAGRGRLLRQFLTESLMLSLGGGLVGIGAAYLGILGMKAAMPPYWLNQEADPALDGRVVLFSLGLTVLTGIIFGLVPALRASRPDLTHSIRQGGGGASVGRGGNRLRCALVVTEVALATVLLGGSGLLLRSFAQMQKVETGFDATNVVTAWLPVANARFPDSPAFLGYVHRLEDRLGALPGVRDVAFTSALPLQGWGWGMPFQVVGSKAIDVSNWPNCFVKMVSPSYFRTLGIKVIKGRSLNDQDVKGSAPAIVINSAMARKFFSTMEPIGKQVSVQEIFYAQTKLGPEIPWEIVGVVADEKVGGLAQSNDYSPGFYVTQEQLPVNDLALVVKGNLAAAALERSITAAVHEVDRDQVVSDMKTLETIKSDSLSNERLRSALLSIFAGVALVLAALGLYGVIAYSVLQRTREIGIRTALGATDANILGMVVRSGLNLTLLGLAIGIAGAIGLAQFLSAVLFNVPAYDPLTLGAVAVLLVVTALFAGFVPARRAVRVNPIVALRFE